MNRCNEYERIINPYLLHHNHLTIEEIGIVLNSTCYQFLDKCHSLFANLKEQIKIEELVSIQAASLSTNPSLDNIKQIKESIEKIRNSIREILRSCGKVVRKYLRLLFSPSNNFYSKIMSSDNKDDDNHKEWEKGETWDLLLNNVNITWKKNTIKSVSSPMGVWLQQKTEAASFASAMAFSHCQTKTSRTSGDKLP
jgi:hypothetical protein